ncbi:MAG: hypothetical protein R2879_15275 [Saprospiraceae bacterium]
MKKLILLFLPLLFINCKKETSREDTHGTKIVRVVKHVDGSKIEMEYSYDNEVRLKEINTLEDEEFYSKSSFFYSNGLLEKLSEEFRSEFLVDSIIWSTREKFDRVYRFSGREAQSVRLKTIETYSYNLAGDSIQKISRDPKTDTIQGVGIFILENGNINQIDRFNSKGNLTSQFFSEYDNYQNFERDKHYGGVSLFRFNKNNITRYEIKEYNRNFGSTPNPMNYYYKYNLDGYPIELSNDFGEKWEMFYE